MATAATARFILHYNSILPTTVGLMGFYALSATYLLRELPRQGVRWHQAALVAIALIFTYADRRIEHYNNTCECHMLERLAQSDNTPVVRLPKSCSVLSWNPVTDPSQSLTNAKLLQHWHITKECKSYCYPSKQ